MYEYINGKISELTPTYVVIECGQIGYFIHISLNTFSALENKEFAKLYIYEAIREDAISLYGFCEKAERTLFLLLTSVSGVGANTARMILSSFSVGELEAIIASGDVAQLKSVKGIGLKTAQRLLVDLKDKVQVSVEAVESLGAATAMKANKEEAITALTMLGFNQQASAKVVDKILNVAPNLPLEKIIKEALKQM
ncbi:MAG: Holliday junction branch migration protein RuvA [Paludibacteraceae bacterium]|nr:Holliday junction branch migration protein RuvA [Paludibacteraceae bacterium]